MIIKRLKDTGLKVNKSITKLWLFHRNNTIPMKIISQGVKITSKKINERSWCHF
jgi:hypothetical protein